MKPFWKYFLLASLFWVVVDYTTAFNPDFSRWFAHMPEIWLFYLGYPLFFSFLIYEKKLGEKSLFHAMLVAMLAVEVLLSNNALLYTFPIMLVMLPIAVCIYCMVTLVPLWIVEKNAFGENKKKTLLCVLVWLVVSFLSYATRARAA